MYEAEKIIVMYPRTTGLAKMTFTDRYHYYIVKRKLQIERND
jgi:hypothetical protein